MRFFFFGLRLERVHERQLTYFFAGGMGSSGTGESEQGESGNSIFSKILLDGAFSKCAAVSSFSTSIFGRRTKSVELTPQ